MTGRPPLPIGAHGNIKVVPLGPKKWEARCRYRDFDGETRKVKRQGRSENAARNNLQAALSERRHSTGSHITAETRLRDAGARWLEQRRAEYEAGELAFTSLTTYDSAWRNSVEPALGGLRLRELTVARCEQWKIELRRRKGPGATKSARTVLSGILGYAARMGAIPANPVRDISTIPGGRRQPVRALTRDERAQWLSAMEDHRPLVAAVQAAEQAGDAEKLASARARLRTARKAVRWDIPDLTRFLLGTAVRVGEALAVSWDEVDFEARTVQIRWHLVPGEHGLVREDGAKSSAGVRLLKIPRWCVQMLRERQAAQLPGTYPVFPDRVGGWRWPTNVLAVFREARDDAGFGWVTSHVFRKTTLTILDEEKLSPRQIADVAGHSDPSMTQRVYMARGVATDEAADALEDLLDGTA